MGLSHEYPKNEWLAWPCSFSLTLQHHSISSKNNLTQQYIEVFKIFLFLQFSGVISVALLTFLSR
jgi:hypothetical protein